MIPTKQNIKNLLIEHIIKEGMSIDDFEQALEKTDLKKMASWWEPVKDIGYGAGIASVGAGMSAAAVLLALEQLSKNQDEDLREEEEIADNEDKLLYEMKNIINKEKAKKIL